MPVPCACLGTTLDPHSYMSTIPDVYVLAGRLPRGRHGRPHLLPKDAHGGACTRGGTWLVTSGQQISVRCAPFFGALFRGSAMTCMFYHVFFVVG